MRYAAGASVALKLYFTNWENRQLLQQAKRYETALGTL